MRLLFFAEEALLQPAKSSSVINQMTNRSREAEPQSIFSEMCSHLDTLAVERWAHLQV